MITTEDIKALRAQTGVSVMQCKKALEEAEGDVEKALIFLRKKSSEVASKKSGRTLGAGTVAAYVHATGALGAMVLLSCETDFVAKNEEFKALGYAIAMHVTATNPEFLAHDEVAKERKEAARAVFEKEVADKPEHLRADIVDGKLKAYFKDTILLEQPFIKDPNTTIAELVAAATQKFGEHIELSRFVRFSAT